MSTLAAKLQRSEFEARIFVSLGIVAAVTIPSLVVFSHAPSLVAVACRTFGASREATVTGWYVFMAIWLFCISLFRMWAGSVLTPRRVMAFKIQVDQLNRRGPYRLVRNPIYLADLCAMGAFGLCLPWPGILMPCLFAWHYERIIRYEEISLQRTYGEEYEAFAREVPRLLPRPLAGRSLKAALGEFRITPTGVRHNALFLLFVPGFLVAASSRDFLHALFIGVPGVIDWAVIHTKIGRRETPRSEEP